jgi:hypothetical protein
VDTIEVWTESPAINSFEQRWSYVVLPIFAPGTAWLLMCSRTRAIALRFTLS